MSATNPLYPYEVYVRINEQWKLYERYAHRSDASSAFKLLYGDYVGCRLMLNGNVVMQHSR